jgi:nucleoside 2-deoxyribosyltransferase
MANPKRVYLAGPDVFLPDAAARGARLKAICAANGLLGMFPLDSPRLAEAAGLAEWRQIALSNEARIRQADAVIANLSPFRGPSADPGTVYEAGFACALGIPVFGWSNCARTLRDRLGGPVDADGLEVENFGLTENLMIPAGIANSGGAMIASRVGAWWDDVTLFERCAALAARVLGAGSAIAQSLAVEIPSSR